MSERITFQSYFTLAPNLRDWIKTIKPLRLLATSTGWLDDCSSLVTRGSPHQCHKRLALNRFHSFIGSSPARRRVNGIDDNWNFKRNCKIEWCGEKLGFYVYIIRVLTYYSLIMNFVFICLIVLIFLTVYRCGSHVASSCYGSSGGFGALVTNVCIRHANWTEMDLVLVSGVSESSSQDFYYDC